MIIYLAAILFITNVNDAVDNQPRVEGRWIHLCNIQQPSRVSRNATEINIDNLVSDKNIFTKRTFLCVIYCRI